MTETNTTTTPWRDAACAAVRTAVAAVGEAASAATARARRILASARGQDDGPPPGTTLTTCIDDLGTIRARVRATIESLQRQHDEHQANARAHAEAGRLAAARAEICLRHLYEQQLQSTRRTLTAVASHMLALDAAQLNREVVRVLRDGSACVGPVASAYDVMGRLETQHDETESLLDLISERPLAVDDAEVDDELEGMLAADGGPACVELPAVPDRTFADLDATRAWTASPSSYSPAAACAASPTPAS